MKKEIYIRPLVETDADTSFRWRNDPDIWKYTGNRPDIHITQEIERNWVVNVLQRKDESRFAICIKETDEYIGNVQLTKIDNYEAEFHIFIGEKQYWGGGYGTMATALMVDHALSVLNLQSLYLNVRKQNTAAVKAYEKAGFYKLIEDADGNIRMAVYAADKRKNLVSVFMLAYNHAKFIEQALEGIVQQKRNFDLEIVVGEDRSSDQTREILLGYAQKYPGVFKLILHSKNVGAHKNQIAVLNACKGKYIAMCEGDDYWTDNNKLLKQIDFLESNPGYSICFHQIQVLQNDGLKVLGGLTKAVAKETYTILDLAKGNFIHTPSVVFRNGLIGELPEWFEKSPVGDYVMHMLNAKHGDIRYFPEPMAVYRMHNNGVWQTLTDIEQCKKLCLVIELILNEFLDNPQVMATLNYQYAFYASGIAESYFQKSDMENFYQYLKKAFDASPEFMKDWLVETRSNVDRIINSRAYSIGRTITRNAAFLKKLYIFKK